MTPDDTSWLASGDIPADPVGDLQTKKNTLSIWHIEDENNLKKVVSGNAANLGNIKPFEYSLFDKEILLRLNLTLKKSPGESKDEEANEKWHWNITNLSGAKLLELAKALLPLSEGRKVVFEPEVEDLIQKAVTSKRIEYARLQPGVRQRIRPPL